MVYQGENLNFATKFKDHIKNLLNNRQNIRKNFSFLKDLFSILSYFERNKNHYS